MCALLLFYQQGVADAIFRSIPEIKDETTSVGPSLNRLTQCLASLKGSLEKATEVQPRLSQAIFFLIAWGGFLLCSLVPVIGHTMIDAGFRYPAYSRLSAGDFVLRSWIVLGLAVLWFGSQLPKAVTQLKMIAPFGFTLYVLHWFFVELAFSRIYVKISLPRKGEPSWQVGLVLSLVFCFLAVLVCHLMLKAVTSQRATSSWSLEELVIRIKTEDAYRKGVDRGYATAEKFRALSIARLPQSLTILADIMFPRDRLIADFNAACSEDISVTNTGHPAEISEACHTRPS